MSKKPKLEIGKKYQFRLNDSPIGTEFCGEVVDITKDRRWVKVLRQDGRENWYSREKLTIVGVVRRMKHRYADTKKQRRYCINQECGKKYRHPSDKVLFCERFCFRIGETTEVPEVCERSGGKK